VNPEATLYLIILVMFFIILALLWGLAKVMRASQRQAERMEGINDYLFNKYLINEKDNENGRTGESS
jgi:hypothetical protein